jgi:hypothetical protein
MRLVYNFGEEDKEIGDSENRGGLGRTTLG